MPAESYSPVPGFPGYEASNWGNIRSTFYGKHCIRKPTVEDGYMRLGLSVGGRKLKRSVHQLVALAFIGPCPENEEVRHRDGNRTNNVPSNLHYGTRSQNMRDVVAHGNHAGANATHCKQGHEFTDANTGRSMSRGITYRTCRKCRVIATTECRLRRLARES